MPPDRPSWLAVLPGLGVLCVLGVAARLGGGFVPGLSPLVLAIGLGVLVANVAGTPSWVRPGLSQHALLLETGIVLLGASLTVDELVRTGPVIVALSVAVVLGGILYLEFLAARIFGLERRPRALLASGASVCGVSAVLAVAGAVDADRTDVTYAVGTILLFDAVTLLVFPVTADLFGLGSKEFGVWAGLSLFSTGPTAAVGFSVSEIAGRWATVTKLVRNSFIGVLAVAYAVRTAATTADTRTSPVEVWNRFPKFLVGFVVVVVVANLGWLSPGATASIEYTTDWLFTLAFVGLGFEIRLSKLRDAGLEPVVLVGLHLITVSALSLLVVRVLF